MQAVAPFLVVIEQTFTSQAVTPRGQTVRFDTEDWLRFATIATPTGTVPGSSKGTPAGEDNAQPAAPAPADGGNQP